MKKIFTLFATAMMAVSMMAATYSFDFSAQDYENGQAIESITIGNGVTATFAKGTNNNAPKYYTSGTAIRLYGSNSMTITSTSDKLTQIKLTFGSGDGTNEITTDCSTFATNTWTGESASVTFTIGGTSGHRRIKVIEVTTEGGDPVDVCPKAIFSVAEGAILDNTEVDAINVNFEVPAGIEADADLFIEGVVTNGADVNDPIMAYTDFEEGVDAGIDYLAEGEYTINITHVAYGEVIDMTEEWEPIYEHEFVAEEGKTLASLHFTIKAAVECPEEGHLFTAAEAKEAYNNECLKKNDVIAIKGYIANMFLKPNNFTKYGSVTIWLTDTLNGNAHEFELYNCYGFKGDTLASYELKAGVDATDGNTNYDVTSVTGRNDMIYRVGDYIEATGKFTLYNGTYELNTGCYLTTGGVAPIDVTGAETFEGINLADGAYIDNAGEAGVFTFGDYYFTNYYDDGYNSWNGFAVSKTTDNTYSILADQYNSCRGGGMDSKTFLVGYYSEFNSAQAPTITANKLFTPEYVCVTNSAWALTSMRDGDSYAKKFDETDFLSLTATGYDEEYEETGSATIYLAKDGKILNQWVKWDLSKVGKCFYMEFTMDCSDKSSGYMNTPSYFCLDNFKATLNDAPTAINNAVETVRAEKRLVNGEVIIVRDGVRYNVLGARK